MKKILLILLCLPILGFGQNLAIGDTYQGGVIFFLDGIGGGLIAAPSDQSSGIGWGCYGTNISGADGVATGTGYQNTIDICNSACIAGNKAANICNNLSLGGYSDWFLPSQAELNEMHIHHSLIGGFGNLNSSVYWSSTELGDDTAWEMNVVSGSNGPGFKTYQRFVRAIRNFVLPVNGCMDSLASNYDSLATIDDGSCICTKSLTQALIGFDPNPVYSLWDWSYDTLTLTNTSNCDVRVRPEFNISHNSLSVDTNDLDITYWNPFGFWTPISYIIDTNGHAVGYWGVGGDTTGQIMSQGTTQQVMIRVRFKPGANYGNYCAVWNTKEVDNIGGSIQTLTSGSSTCLSFVNLNCTNFSVLNSYSSDITCSNSNDGNAGILHMQNGSGDYLYNWSNGDTTNTITDLFSGNYYCIITDKNWPQCSDSIGFTIAEPALIDNGITVNNSTCFGSDDGYAKIDPTKDGITLTNFEVFWNSNSNLGQTDSLSLVLGVHIVRVLNTITGCLSEVDTFEISEPPLLTSSFTQTNNLCFGDTSGSAIVTFLGGTIGTTQGDTNYILGWAGTPVPVYLPYPQNTFNTTLLPTPYNAIPTGVYPYTVTDMNGCIIYDTITITEPDSLSLTLFADTICCSLGSYGTATAITNGGITPYSFIWSPSGSSLNIATGLSAGTQNLMVTDANNCTISGDIEIYEYASISTSTTTISPLCFGDSNGCINTNTIGGDGSYTYIWSNGENTANICNLPAGNYTCLITDGCGCTEFLNITISQPDQISVNIDSLNNISIYGNNDGSIYISTYGGSGLHNINWNNNIGFASNNEDVSNLLAGFYYLEITDINLCNYEDTIELTQPSSLWVNLDLAINTSCFDSCDGTLNITANGGDSTYIYSWYGPNGFTSNNNNLSNLCAGTYIITVNDGITTIADTFNIIQPYQLTSNLSVDSIVCYNGSAQAEINVWGGTQPLIYSWSNGGNSYLTTVNSGTYSISVSDQNGCSIIHSFALLNPDSIISTTSSTNINCFGGNNGSVSISIISGGTASYNFSDNDGLTYQSTNTFINLSAGNYSFLIIDANGCLDSTSANINEPYEMISTTTSINASCYDSCNGSTGVTINGGTPPYSYLWNNGQSTQNILSLCAGFYNITITDSNNCLSTSSAIINVPAPLLINIWIDGNTLVASNGFSSYQWYENSNNPILGANDSILNPINTGLYSVVVTDTNGCSEESYRINYSISSIDDYYLMTKIYPNPTNGLLTIEANYPINNITVINSLGNQLLEVENIKEEGSSKIVDLSTFAKGIYFIEIEQNNQILNYRIVLQ